MSKPGKAAMFAPNLGDSSRLLAEAAVKEGGAKPVGVAPVQLRQPVVSLEERLSASLRVRNEGGLLDLGQKYTAESATERRLPLRKFKLSELVVHPYNVRPVSAGSDIASLSDQLKAEGQLDPIHVVPYKTGWAIMEGQRRWLASPAAGLTELDGWVHPEPDDSFEVYAFGQMIHKSRKDTTAFDQAVVWGRMMDDKLFTTTSDLARRAQVDDSKVSRSLSILRVGTPVLDEIRAAAVRFTDRHLYALTQIHGSGGIEQALKAARAVATAPADKPISARKLEALAASFAELGSAPTRGRRKNSVPLLIRSEGGAVMGELKSYRDGRLEFKPAQPLNEANAENLAEVIRLAVASELQKQTTKA